MFRSMSVFRSSIFRNSFVISLGLGVFAVVGCGGDDEGGNGDGDISLGDGDGDISLGDGDGDTGGDGDIGVVDGCNPEFGEECSGITYEGENVPLDIYVMFDLSCSMSCTVDQSGCCMGGQDEASMNEWRITPVRAAMTSFLEDPRSAGIGVGLGFFGDHNVNDNTDPDVCNVAAHEDAAVEIQRLPDSANELISTLNSEGPQGGTPTHLAIEGACNYTETWKNNNPAHKVVILLVTDGIPEHSCQANIQLATSAAEDCFDETNREIYVLGIDANVNNNGGQSSLEQLNAIAEAGGTDQAYITDANNVESSVLEALNAIRADAVIPCTLNIPEPSSGTINYDQVNVGICDASEATVSTYRVEDPVDCDHGAWYYELVGNEQVVQLCDQTCDTVSASGASLTMTVGCDTIVVPVR